MTDREQGVSNGDAGIRGQEVHGDITLGKGLRRMTYTPEDCGNLISQYRLLGC